MAIPPSLTRISRLYFRPKTTVASSPVPFAASSHVTFLSPSKSSFSLPPSSSPPTLNFCAAYAPRAQLFASRRAEASLPSHRCRRLTRVFGPLPGNLPGSEPTELPSAPISSEPGFEDFVKRKLPMDEPKTKEMHAFDSDNYIQPDESNPPPNAKAGAEIGECKRRVASDGVFDGRNVFVKMDIPAKKVKLSKCLKKAPNGEPCILTRGGVLPPKWDGSSGTVVLVNKPKGWTSFTVCDKLRGLVKVKKVGHAGTLDPMATGLLIVCVGKATKSVERFQSMIKGYSGIFRLGETTSTLDADSPVIQRESWEHIKDDDIKKAAATFCGEIWQVPPMFSAVKVRGQRMYEKARRGEIMELSPRRITVSEFVIQRSLEDRQNLVFRARCSKGTYIRSLCADFGMALGSCAHLTALKRDSIGQYSAEDAWEFEELSETILGGRL